MVRIAGQIAASGLALALLQPAAARAADEVLAIVTGVAPGDLLNLRETASPAGRVRIRIGNGESVRNFGCSEFNGYQWCKVEVVNQPGTEGWVPARYLLAVDSQDTATAGDGAAGGAAASAAPLPDLSARFGDDAPAARTGSAPDETGLRGLTPSDIEAYRKDFEKQAQTMAAANREAAGDASSGRLAALANPPGSAWDATGEIPCARYPGQAMVRCQAGVRRMGDGKADVTVVWPDGGTSVISFDKGEPVGASSPGKFRFLRESGLNMIRVGASERFEITDRLAFGG